MLNQCYRYGPVAMVHVDAHSDCTWSDQGEKIAHATPFARALEEDLLDCQKVFQIGIRGCTSGPDSFDWQKKKVGRAE